MGFSRFSKKSDEYENIYGDGVSISRPGPEDNEHPYIYKIDAKDEFVNGAYDEDGDCASCDRCDGELRFEDGQWVCRECGNVIDRPSYFNYIGAEPPGDACITCGNNYPLCKRWCHIYNVEQDKTI